MRENFLYWSQYESEEEIYDWIDTLNETDRNEFKKEFPDIFKTFEFLNYYKSIFKLQIEILPKEK